MNKTAFTLAEVLITLVIIGVIAAITVPTIMNNTKKAQTISQIKATYTLIANGFKLAMAKDGVTRLDDTSIIQSIIGNATHSGNQSAFRKEINKIFATMKDSDGNDIPVNQRITYKSLDQKTTFTVPYSASGGGWNPDQTFYLNNGALMYITAYDDTNNNPRIYVFFDINAEKKPNVQGRDLFHMEINSKGAQPSDKETYKNQKLCDTKANKGYNGGSGCLARIMDESWEMNY